jgi:hypothetical protein
MRGVVVKLAQMQDFCPCRSRVRLGGLLRAAGSGRKVLDFAQPPSLQHLGLSVFLIPFFMRPL